MSEERAGFVANGLRLEGRLSVPEGATRAAVLCHPHPQYGGSMDNNVIDGLVRRLAAAAIATLRFNFRGVGASEGAYGNLAGECEDARAAVAWMRERTGLGALALVGYSFGAIVALRAGHDDPRVDRLVAVAPPLSMFAIDFLASCAKPKLLLVGDRDQFCSSRDFERAVESMERPVASHQLAGTGHFFGGVEDEVGSVVAEFIAGDDREFLLSPLKKGD